MPSFPRRALLPGTALLLGALLAGCSPPPPKRGDVKGKVTYKGKPIDARGGQVRVSFIAADNSTVTVVADGEGNYTAQGVLEGENQVLVSCTNSSANQSEQGGKPTGSARESQGRKDAINPPIPEQYSQPGRSGLTLTVEGGKEQVFNVDLTD
jgi:hypothetical protein